MGIIDKFDKLLAYMCAKYENSDVFRAHGEFPHVLISEASIDFGDAYGQVAAFQPLLDQGWIEIVPMSRNEKTRDLYMMSRVRPTYAGMVHIREKKKPWIQKNWPKIWSSSIEGFIKGIKY
jgi:hypothetical protein